MTPEHFDLIVIGGGINGAGIARDAALRGLKVLILDKNDFAYGTSSRSTKLIHGGIRYLENFEFKLVWEACHERKILTQIAPHLVKMVPFVIPVYEGDKRRLWMVRAGMILYDLMAGLKNIKSHKPLSAKKIKKIIPGINEKGLVGGGIYYDCQTNDARLTLANIQDAVRHGASAQNYTEVANLYPHKKGLEIQCQNVLTTERQTFTASYIVNATGPWMDINLQKWNLGDKKQLQLSKGVHFFTNKIAKDYALLISSKSDNRVFFVIPWGDYSLVGTTDTDFKGNPDNAEVKQDDINYLSEELQRLFPEVQINNENIFGEYAGIRPLVKTSTDDRRLIIGKISREYTLKEDKIGETPILHVIGGKLTTYRNLSKKVVNKVMLSLHKGKLGENTKSKPLPGSEFREKPINKAGLSSLPEDIAENIINTYGTETNKILPYLNKKDAKCRIIRGKPFIWAQLYYGMDHEYVKTPADFIWRRTELYIQKENLADLERKISENMKRYK